MKPDAIRTATATDRAVALNLAALDEMLEAAHKLVAEACDYMESDNRNAAIGTILGMEQLLADVRAIHAATIALHRRAPA